MVRHRVKRITNAATLWQTFWRRHPLPDPGDGVNRSKVNFFQNMVMLHIKLKGREFSNIVANKMHAYPLPHDPRGWGQNSNFSEHGHVAYQITENHTCSSFVANI